MLSLLLHRADESVTLRMPRSADGTAFSDSPSSVLHHFPPAVQTPPLEKTPQK